MKARTTGMQYRFWVATQRADGSHVTIRGWTVVELSTAGAWRAIGKRVCKMMRGPRPKLVTSIELQRP